MTVTKRTGTGTHVSTDQVQVERPVEQDRRFIYNGDPQAVTPGYAIRPNRRAIRRRRSTFNIIATLFGLAVGIILYIGNILAVNRLAMEIHELEKAYGKINSANEALRADINRKSAWDRIGKIATGDLGLVYPKDPPQRLEVDEALIEEISEQ